MIIYISINLVKVGSGINQVDQVNKSIKSELNLPGTRTLFAAF